MSKRAITVAATALSVGMAVPVVARAQTAEGLVGTWKGVSVSIQRPNGTKFDPWGGKLNGLAIFSSDGYIIQENTRSDVPKVAAGDRQKGTSEENKAIVTGSYAYFGTYSYNPAEHTITVHVLGSSFPNEVGTTRKLTSVALRGSELTWINPAPSTAGQGALNILRRVK